jgi:hypothetical protein
MTVFVPRNGARCIYATIGVAKFGTTPTSKNHQRVAFLFCRNMNMNEAFFCKKKACKNVYFVFFLEME